VGVKYPIVLHVSCNNINDITYNQGYKYIAHPNAEGKIGRKL
jgi:hypothetical protein